MHTYNTGLQNALNLKKKGHKNVVATQYNLFILTAPCIFTIY